MQRSVLSLVHHTHPPAPELLDDAVMRDGLPDHSSEGTQGAMLGVLRRRSQRTRSTHATESHTSSKSWKVTVYARQVLSQGRSHRPPESSVYSRACAAAGSRVQTLP